MEVGGLSVWRESDLEVKKVGVIFWASSPRHSNADKVAHTLKRSPELPEVFWQSILRAKREGGCCGVCDELVHSSLIGWC